MRMHAPRAALIALLLASATGATPQPAAAAKRPLTVEDVLERPGADLPSLTWLPDSDRLLFTLGHYYEPQPAFDAANAAARTIVANGGSADILLRGEKPRR